MQYIILNDIFSKITVFSGSLEMLLVTRWERGLRNAWLVFSEKSLLSTEDKTQNFESYEISVQRSKGFHGK